jgi:hypothetical protein
MIGWRPKLRAGMAWALAAGVILPGTVAAQTPAASGEREAPRFPVIVDANGRVVGGVFGFGVRVQVGDRAAVLEVGQNQFIGGQTEVAVLFESDDCEGPAFLYLSAPPGVATMLGDVGVGPPNLLLAPAGVPEIRTVRSIWVARLSPPACISGTAVDLEVVPSVALMDLGIFTPPSASSSRS